MLILFLIVLIDLIGFGIIIPLLPFYAEHFEADPATVGVLMAIYSLTQFIAAPVLGRMSDRLGRRPVLLWSLGGAVLSYIWLGFADSLIMLFLARAFGGFMAGNIGAAFAYIADVTTPENRAKGMGMIGAAFGLGFIIGPAIGGILAGPDAATANYQLPAFAAAALSGVAFLMATVMLKESLSAETRADNATKPRKGQIAQFREAFTRPVLGLMILLTFLSTFVFAGMEATFAMWSERSYGWGPEQNGYLFAFVGLLSAAVQGGAIGRLARRFGERKLIIQGSIALAIGLGLIPFSTTLPMLIVAMVFLAYGFSITTPSLSSLISQHAGDHERGALMGVSRSASTMARVLGPTWAGLLFAMLGKDWPFLGGALIMVAVVVMSMKKLSRADA